MISIPPPDLAAVRPPLARAFGGAACTYDLHAELQRQVADELLQTLADGPLTATSLLDLGCGTGYCSALLRERWPEASLVALDLALPMLERTAARAVPALHLLCADAQCLPFTAASFDLIVSSLAIQWCADPRGLFEELFRVLRSGACVLLSTLGPATLQEVRGAWSHADDTVHVNAFAPLEVLHAAATGAGFHWQLRQQLRLRHYESLRAVAAELRGIGARNQHQDRKRGLTTRTAFAKAEQAFAAGRQPQGIPVTWELYYLELHKP